MTEREARDGGDAAEGYVDARESVLLLWRGRWVVLAAVALGVALALVRAWLISPRYEATVRLRQLVSTGGIDPAQAAASVELLRSPTLAARVVAELGLPITVDDLLEDELDVEQAAAGSTLLEIRARWTDPAGAARLANRYAEEGLSFYRSVRKDDSRAVRERLEDELDAAQARLVAPGPPDAGRDQRIETLRRDLARLSVESHVEQLVDLARQEADLKIVDSATEPVRPVRPRPLRDALVGAGLGAVLALVALFAYAIVGPAGPRAGALPGRG